ncbi:MAG: hypothetical protein JWN76_1309 [Chitinophagaceae bacterium]|nr:hypothetical protein [Chitinophagaceae bacterium]
MKKYISILSLLFICIFSNAQTRNTSKFHQPLIKTALDRGAKMYNLGEILEEFHINPKHKNLRVCIDKDIIDHPELLMTDLNDIDDVVIASGRYLGFTDASVRQEPFIYITRKKLKEVHI